jgi:manganese/zinc/iron transport system permease protein
MAMVGDAISHSVLPGIALAYFATGSRSLVPTLVGATGFGVLCTVGIEWLHKKARLQSDAAIGVVFTGLFALGVVLITAFAAQTDLDQDCVLYGEIAYTPLDVWITQSGINLGAKAIWVAAVNLIILVIFIFFGFRGLFLTSFDTDYARSIGINVGFWHYALMCAVSLTTVCSFEAVGAILVVAFLIVPPSAAYLITTNFKKMIVYTIVFSVLSATIGYYIATAANGSIAGAMSTTTGLIFIIIWIYTYLKKRRITHASPHSKPIKIQ